ncbi:unnamed protein product [Ixodes persulcatus]
MNAMLPVLTTSDLYEHTPGGVPNNCVPLEQHDIRHRQTPCLSESAVPPGGHDAERRRTRKLVS